MVAIIPTSANNIAGSMNPPFHPNIVRIFGSTDSSDWASFSLYRGAIIKKEGDRGVRFLYNPSQLGLTHPIDPNQPPPLPNASPATTNIASTGGQISFSLLFDRTYECWYDSSYAGVLVDVRAFYALTGILDDGNNVAPDAIKPMTPTPAFFYFGQNGPKSNVATTRPLAYYGYIDNLTVTYTHWSVNMIPMRCAVDVSATLIPGGATDPAPTGPPIGVQPHQGGPTQVTGPPVGSALGTLGPGDRLSGGGAVLTPSLPNGVPPGGPLD